uniref:Putative secreted protein n=1 Tax=Anopheles marajoara TaxID=58244 RepID=A0A2M4CFK2_9DIPT
MMWGTLAPFSLHYCALASYHCTLLRYVVAVCFVNRFVNFLSSLVSTQTCVSIRTRANLFLPRMVAV